MFGGFGSAYFSAYHKIIPKSLPVEEYEDRIELYTLYSLPVTAITIGIISSIILPYLVEVVIEVVRERP